MARTAATAPLAFADRAAWHGVPGQVDVPMVELLSDGYADERRSAVAGEASMELRPIELPRFRTGHFPSSFHPRQAMPVRLFLEDGFAPDVVAALRARGHDVEVSGPGHPGSRLSAVLFDQASGLLRAAADPRGRQCYAVGR